MQNRLNTYKIVNEAALKGVAFFVIYPLAEVLEARCELALLVGFISLATSERLNSMKNYHQNINPKNHRLDSFGYRLSVISLAEVLEAKLTEVRLASTESFKIILPQIARNNAEEIFSQRCRDAKKQIKSRFSF